MRKDVWIGRLGSKLPPTFLLWKEKNKWKDRLSFLTFMCYFSMKVK